MWRESELLGQLQEVLPTADVRDGAVPLDEPGRHEGRLLVEQVVDAKVKLGIDLVDLITQTQIPGVVAPKVGR